MFTRWAVGGSVATAVVVAVMAFGPSVARAETGEEATIRQLREQVAALQAENQRLKAELDKLRGEAPGAGTEASAAAPDRRVQELEQALEAERARVASLENERGELEKIAGVSAKGELIASHAARITSTYDAEADRTRVEAASVPVLKNNLAGFSEFAVAAAFEFAGERMAEPPATCQLVLYTRANPNRLVRQARSATLVIDGEAVEVPVASYEVLAVSRSSGTGRTGAGRTETRDERLALALDEPLARRVGAATSLALELHGLRFELGRDHIAMLEGIRLRPALMLKDQGAD